MNGLENKLIGFSLSTTAMPAFDTASGKTTDNERINELPRQPVHLEADARHAGLTTNNNMPHISYNTYCLLTTLIRNANGIFLWGFMYYLVFLYLIRGGHYRVPNKRQAEDRMTYVSSWMLLLWVTTVLSAMCIDLFMQKPSA